MNSQLLREKWSTSLLCDLMEGQTVKPPCSSMMMKEEGALVFLGLRGFLMMKEEGALVFLGLRGFFG